MHAGLGSEALPSCSGNRRVFGVMSRVINNNVKMVVATVYVTGTFLGGSFKRVVYSFVCNFSVVVLCAVSDVCRKLVRVATGGIFRVVSRYTVFVLVTKPCAPVTLYSITEVGTPVN